MTCDIMELFAKRHSFYEINNHLPVQSLEVVALIKDALKLYPSPFNSQSARVVLLSGSQHLAFWELTKQELFKSAPKEKYDGINTRISSFAKGFGTLLYFIETDIVQKQEQQMPLYATNFKNWAYQCNAILQFMIWSAFANKEIGASLQHYNPLIDETVKTTYNLPESWELVAQMPFGGIGATPPPHSVSDLEEKLLILE